MEDIQVRFGETNNLEEQEEEVGDKNMADGKELNEVTMTKVQADEDEVHKEPKVDYIATINSMQFKPIPLSRMSIPHCLLTPMPIMQPTLKCDLKKIDEEFCYGYRDGTAVFYVSNTNDKGEVNHLSTDERASLYPLWKIEVDQFEEYLDSILELQSLKNLKFYICDGNHRHIAWMKHIDLKHSADPAWYYKVDCILLETKGHLGPTMQAMHEINK